ncbi:putative enzyme related to lactoylglutathione lyase [Bradyrhizobium sp. LB7.1]
MVDLPGRFVWYELLTTDMPSAAAFYAEVVGWAVKDASSAELAYSLLTAGEAPVVGLMDLPEERGANGSYAEMARLRRRR